MAHMETEATHMAHSACEAVAVALVGSEATHTVYSTCEADVMAHVGPEQVHIALGFGKDPVRTEKTRKAYPACEAVRSPAWRNTCSDVRSDAQCGSSL